MKNSVTLDLVSRYYEQDENAVNVATEETKTIYAYMDSVTSSEFFDGQRSGIRPELRFRVQRCDYSGEDVIVYEGVRYTVYRTYMDGDWIELYTARRKGNE